MTAVALPHPLSQRQLLRWTGAEFDRAAETGVFDGKRVELIDGYLLERDDMNDPHGQGIRLGTYALMRAFPADQWTISVQCPMRLGESRPFPDLVIVPGTPREVSKHPETAALVIEVSDTTLEFDRTEKAELYAQHLLPEYWVVDLSGRRIEVFRNPSHTTEGGFRYTDIRSFKPDDVLHPLAAPTAAINVQDLLL